MRTRDILPEETGSISGEEGEAVAVRDRARVERRRCGMEVGVQTALSMPPTEKGRFMHALYAEEGVLARKRIWEQKRHAGVSFPLPIIE